MSELESRLAALESRNARVELDKKWETSWTRRLAIAAATYFILGGYLWAIGAEPWWVHAVVPTCGYLLGGLALPIIRRVWQARQG